MKNDPVLGLRFRMKYVQERCYDELVGLCKGILADGQVNQAEAEFLHNWLQAHPELADQFPCDILTQRLALHFADGLLDDEEAQDLLFLLKDMTGEKGQQGKGAAPTELAFNNPMPSLAFPSFAYVLTGTFQAGIRQDISKHLEQLGAVIKNRVIKSNPCILVVGALVTPAWIHSTHGRKIEEAVRFRDEGRPISIVSETHLFDELERQNLLP